MGSLYTFLSRAKETETGIIPAVILQLRGVVWWHQLKTTTTRSVNRRAESSGHWWRRTTLTHTRTHINHIGAVALQGDTATPRTTEPKFSFCSLFGHCLNPFLKHSTLYSLLHWFSPMGKHWSRFTLLNVCQINSRYSILQFNISQSGKLWSWDGQKWIAVRLGNDLFRDSGQNNCVSCTVDKFSVHLQSQVMKQVGSG